MQQSSLRELNVCNSQVLGCLRVAPRKHPRDATYVRTYMYTMEHTYVIASIPVIKHTHTHSHISKLHPYHRICYTCRTPRVYTTEPRVRYVRGSSCVHATTRTEVRGSRRLHEGCTTRGPNHKPDATWHVLTAPCVSLAAARSHNITSQTWVQNVGIVHG